MLKREQLAEWLQMQNVEALATQTGLSSKTIYRLRRGKTRPSYQTMELLMQAGAKAAPKRRQSGADAAQGQGQGQG